MIRAGQKKIYFLGSVFESWKYGGCKFFGKKNIKGKAFGQVCLPLVKL